MENYYENLLREGVSLNALVMTNKNSWEQFKKIEQRHANVKIDTISNSMFHLYSNIKNDPIKYNLAMYDLFLFSDDAKLNKMISSDLDRIGRECSINKRTTVGYLYHSEQTQRKREFQFTIKSYLNGECDFTDIEYIDFTENREEIDFLNLVSEMHMNRVNNQSIKR